MQERKNRSKYHTGLHDAVKIEPWLQAEKLPNYLGYYVRKDIIEQLRNNTNHLICGRRGTGKTHFLGAFSETINQDNEKNELSIFISCLDLSTTPQVIIDENRQFSIQKYTRILFKSFLIQFCYQLAEKIDKIVIERLGKSKTKKELKIITGKSDDLLLMMLKIVEHGIPIAIKETITSTEKKIDTNNKSNGIQLHINGNNNGVGLKAILGFENDRKKTSEKSSTDEVIATTGLDIVEFKVLLNELITTLEIETLYILIDEWMELDKNLNLGIQPYFAQLLKITFFNNKYLSIKIASVWHNTNLYDRNILEKSKGIELGEDIVLGMDLDVIFLKEEDKIFTFIKNMLFRRIVNLVPEMAELERDDEVNDQFLIELFDSIENFKTFVIASHGIPRDCLHIFHSCSLKIGRDFKNYAITRDLIRDIAQEIYLSEKRKSLDKNSAAQKVFDLINCYLDNTGINYFLIDADVSKKSISLRKLVDEQLIHPLASESTPRIIRNSYKVFMIDYGNYVDWYQEKRKKIEVNIVDNIFPQFPENFEDVYPSFILDISEIGEDIIICPACSKSFKKNEPVYLRFESCPFCAEKVPKDT
jgi:hypothetical protein